MIRKPNLFIVGAPKCGTSFLYKYLSLHPDIYMSPVKEPNFFDKDLTYKSRLSLEKYLQLFKESGNKKVLGEASVLYLFSKVAAEEIYSFNPDAKILITIRRPVDMMYSLHSENLYQGNENEKDFETALKLEGDRIQGKKTHIFSNPSEVVFYKSIAKFSHQIERYYSVFGKEKVKVILFDDIKNNPQKVYKDVLSFLEVQSIEGLNFYSVNENKKVKSAVVRDFFKHPPQIFKSFIKLLIPFQIIRNGIQSFFLKINTKKVKREKIDSNLEKKIQQEMKDEINRLSELIGKNLSTFY